MGFISKVKSFFGKAKKEVVSLETDIISFVTKNAHLIVGLMAVMDTFYDNNKGSQKMKDVTKIAITAINNKFGTNLNPEDSSNEVVAALEKLFQNIYDTIYKLQATQPTA